MPLYSRFIANVVEEPMSAADVYLWTLTVIALAGTVLNVRQQRLGFLFWIVSNLGFAIENALRGIYPVAVLFSVYLILAVAGWFSWKSKPGDLEEAATVIEVAD